MFVGGLPKDTLAQVGRLISASEASEVYVCCSGSFRLEQLLMQTSSRARIIGNDVSLLTCAIGELACGRELELTYHGRLAFLEDHLAGHGYRRRVGALLLASEMSRYTAKNEFSANHMRHYQDSAPSYLEKAEERLTAFLATFRLDDFRPRDFLEHSKEGAERGALVLGFPPTYKSGYERMYKFIHENTRWNQPSYAVFDPENVETWVRSLADAGAAYCVGADRRFGSMEPSAAFSPSGKHTIYVYARSALSSYARTDYSIKRFGYRPIDADSLTADSQVDIVPTGAGEMNFLKERYLARGIVHTTGSDNFLVFVGGRLCGGFIYMTGGDPTSFKGRDPLRSLYLLSDFSVSRERRLSKLIAMLATCKLCVSIAERKQLRHYQQVVSTAFTDKPVSMKYRGIYDLIGRGEGHLNYASPVRNASPQEIYREWFRRYGSQAA